MIKTITVKEAKLFLKKLKAANLMYDYKKESAIDALYLTERIDLQTAQEIQNIVNNILRSKIKI
tara:strand:- start:1980 stop:2171 length:192 start_codon:yes stop_codon:yes gene_type:complete